MTKLVKSLVGVVQVLSPKERRQFFKGLLDAGMLTDDEQDELVLAARASESTRPLSDFVSDMKRKGRIK